MKFGLGSPERMIKTLLVTGGAGFIGSNFVRFVRRTRATWNVVTLDALTYAGNLANLSELEDDPQHTFVRADIADRDSVADVFQSHRPDAVVHFAAESHVDRSIESSLPFLRTNVLGTQILVDAVREFGTKRLLHVSTDEVYGSLESGVYATEEATLNPSNPYAASKAASDHLVLAAVNTHRIPAMVTRCSNNFGPYQFPEKFIPLMVANAIDGRPLPIYGDGLHERDWIHVDDHCSAVLTVLEEGSIGRVYNVAGSNHRTNLDLARLILAEVDRPEDLLTTVADRPGHDRRYAPCDDRIRTELGWAPKRGFEAAMRETIDWYRDNGAWLDLVRSGEYQSYYERRYGSSHG